jgi:hypothetical protein
MRINPIVKTDNIVYRESPYRFDRHIRNNKYGISFYDILKRVEKNNK